ncbi:hypothetical protein EVAR_31108_1 [Eumeta japonica]|uniref:Uncharacterized protein n=1 Tax=Eumeta variegata TaxID=151549 RepID=A0A4C1VFW1_EUMVA|nr:hypothetical protein EVAR_31108_1 [Eumeta japonica]
MPPFPGLHHPASVVGVQGGIVLQLDSLDKSFDAARRSQLSRCASPSGAAADAGAPADDHLLRALVTALAASDFPPSRACPPIKRATSNRKAC